MRSVLCENGSGRVSGFSRGVVVGWLPADESDFVSEETGKPAALWHVELEGDLGEEDLEEFELVEAEELYATRKGNVEIDDEVRRRDSADSKLSTMPQKTIPKELNLTKPSPRS